jgi:hypothetical protein
MSVYVSVPNFPEPGTPPDLTFYYNRNWLNVVTLADQSSNSLSNLSFPITLKDTDDHLTQAIGYALVPEAASDKVLTDPFVIQFTQAAGSGSITFTDNQLSTDNTWGPDQTLTFQLTGGTGNYAFSQGFVTVKTTADKGRYFYVYFFKSTTSIPDLRGTWDYSIKVLRLENPTDTLAFPRSYKFSDASGVTLSQDWDGDKRFVFLYIPAAGVLRPNPGYQPGILTFVNGQLQLELSDYDDNGVYTARVTKRDSAGNIIEFTGLYTEAGFSSTNPDQKPTAGEWTLKKRV